MTYSCYYPIPTPGDIHIEYRSRSVKGCLWPKIHAEFGKNSGQILGENRKKDWKKLGRI